jgi:hypothetical protein
LFGDTELATGVHDPDALGRLNLNGPQMPDDLFRRVPFPCHVPLLSSASEPNFIAGLV